MGRHWCSMDEISLFNKMTSFAKAMAVQIAAGCPIANEEEQKKRRDICGGCPSLMHEEYRCGECKCYITIKASLKTSKCPLNKWPDLMKKEKSSENKDL